MEETRVVDELLKSNKVDQSKIDQAMQRVHDNYYEIMRNDPKLKHMFEVEKKLKNEIREKEQIITSLQQLTDNEEDLQEIDDLYSNRTPKEINQMNAALQKQINKTNKLLLKEKKRQDYLVHQLSELQEN